MDSDQIGEWMLVHLKSVVTSVLAGTRKPPPSTGIEFTGLPPRNHGDRFCAENSSHLSELLSVDHDHLSMAFFAAHKTYSLPLEGLKTEKEIFQSLVDQHPQDQDAAVFLDMWEKPSSKVNTLGVGRGCIVIIGWQHIFAETRYGLAKLLDKRLLHENLMILPAK
jgi:hypothetical protein